MRMPTLTLSNVFRSRITLICSGIFLSTAFAHANAFAAEQESPAEPGTPVGNVDFVRDIQPILRKHCYECHAGTTEEGGLNLGVKAKALAGGDSGAPIVAGKNKASLLIQLVTGIDADRVMPPEGNQRLTDRQISLLRAWVDQGAAWPDDADVVDPKLDRARQHWAFQRLGQKEAPPRRAGDNWSKGPIDLFIRQRLIEAGLRPSTPANGRTLVRRLYFDLIGLPPTQTQTHQFLDAHAKDPDSAVRELVDELLTSPRYGERWGRHWLDVARYADSDGQEADQDRPHAYTYRDFVIQAFNDNMPYDQFVRWQIAGDEFEPEKDAAVAATGIPDRRSRPSSCPSRSWKANGLMNRYNELDDVISTLGSGNAGNHRRLCSLSRSQVRRVLRERVLPVNGRVSQWRPRRPQSCPSGQGGVSSFRTSTSQRRTTWLFRRSDFYDREIEVASDFPAMLSAECADAELLTGKRPKKPTREIGEPQKARCSARALADWITDTERRAAERIAGSSLREPRVAVTISARDSWARPATLASAAMQAVASILVARVPEPAKFVARTVGKPNQLHRKILTSAVWQQSSTRGACDERGPDESIPGNRLLWRMTPQRLEAEAMRDAMLAVSDTLNLRSGRARDSNPTSRPRPTSPETSKGKLPRGREGQRGSTRRRSVYMFHKRLIPYPMFQAFDRPDFMTSCAHVDKTQPSRRRRWSF